MHSTSLIGLKRYKQDVLVRNVRKIHRAAFKTQQHTEQKKKKNQPLVHVYGEGESSDKS